MSTESTERIEQRAGEWLARRDSAFWSEQQQAELEQWVNESLEHRVAWLRLLDTWENTLRLRALGAGVQSERPPPPGHWNVSPFFTPSSRPLVEDRASAVELAAQGSSARRGQGSRVWFRALAASVVLAGVLGSVWHWSTRDIYDTPVGGLASLPMADGSSVVLNTNSEIKVELTDLERRIDLRHGEAFFQVAKDPTRPFVVAVGNRRIVAIGTAFSVRREKQEVRVVVTEGVVQVEEGAETQVLTAGSIAWSDKAGLAVQTRKLHEVEEQIAWRGGNVVFRDVSLAEAVAEFNRYNKRQIVVEAPGSSEYTVGGVFRTNNVDAFVRLLERAYPLQADFQSDIILLTPR